MKKEIKEVSCNVQGCMYHAQGNKCTAGHIQVSNPTATVNSETLCATFESCDGCQGGCASK